MKIFPSKIKNITLLFLSLTTLSFVYSTAQSKKEDKLVISTKPFHDGVNHWYNISDNTNVINPTPDQPKYNDSEYIKIADNIVNFQRDNGGWPKNYDMSAILTATQIDSIIKTKSLLGTTFDNATTYTHTYYLAQVYTATKNEKYKNASLKGIDFILEAQYLNGGWPQYFPLVAAKPVEEAYKNHITFNDGAYIGVMNLLQKVIDNDLNLTFVDANRRKKITKAYEKGIDCILKMQIENKGKLTAWCQQYDEVTLLPAWARSFEPPSICNSESAEIVLFLMDVKNPDKRTIKSIQSAVKWFSDSKIYNTKLETFSAPEINSQYKYDNVSIDRKVVTDPAAPPIWTRFYELNSERPLFCDRNSKYLYSLAEVSRERRTGYVWYTYNPEKVFEKYPEWQKKWDPTTNVLKPSN